MIYASHKFSKEVIIFHAKREEITASMKDNTVDIVIEDPPFGVRDEQWDDKKLFIKTLRDWLWESLRISKHGVIWFCASRMMPWIFRGIHGHEEYFKRMHVWDKPEGTQFAGASNNNIWFSIEPILVFSKNWDITKTYGKDMPFAYDTFQYRTIAYKHNGHPTSKPVSLMRKLVGHYSNPGELVFDGFGGSFSTAMACIDMGRRVISCEQSPNPKLPIVEDGKSALYNPDFYNRGYARIKKHLDNPRLFVGEADDTEDYNETLNMFEE